ncbi:glycosyl hydrolase family 95 catalytic domain-containing protein [Rubellicoccus peritrichatus]|uniref:Glycoside hydrolase N-terminal domain-containing protein n=1 Tax=Rubellicoccus peritrichatus TaxID=3080537 RepID=A0AAQ3LGW1_9BACT|nr:glycoside hydrolase N-terminal domain-containing protein [Puniceicoccus sp. CR14]WOO43588.1 glycoside hydrolase N-terminal domain-containing protein [Puniceicoccus sp. CR14]
MSQLSKTFLSFSAAAFSCVSTYAASPLAVGDHNYSGSPAANWRDALVSGNGVMGIMVMGDPWNERIILNHEFLYEFLGTEDVPPTDVSKKIPEIKQLYKDGRYHDADALFHKTLKEEGNPGFLMTDPYHPAGALVINQDFEGSVDNYSRVTSYEDGQLIVAWTADGVDYKRASFVSRPDSVIATHISASEKGSIDLTLQIEHQIDREALLEDHWKAWLQENVKLLFPERVDELSIPLVDEADYTVSDEWLVFRVPYQVYDRGYEIVGQIRATGGKVSAGEGAVRVEDADVVDILVQIETTEPYSNSLVADMKKHLSGLGTYEELLKAQDASHGEMYRRVNFELDKTGFVDGSNEELLLSQGQDSRINPYLLEKLFNMGVYGLISSSGENPPNLVGIWTGEWRPIWSGDFTTNANVNLQVSGANILGLPEAIDSYMTMLERIAPDWEVNAKNLFNADGYSAGTRTSGRRNLHSHIGRYGLHAWSAGAGWLLNPCYEYYQCTGDEVFLEERLLPMMLKVALFYETFLDTVDENGDYLFAPSWSPENSPSTPLPKLPAVVNATMDIAVCRELLTNLIVICEEKGLYPDRVARWKEILDNLPPYLVNEDGALKEWAHEDLADNYDHRHSSHLYGVWPSLEINPEDSPELFEAARVATEKRGRGNGSAHGLAHVGLLAARLKMDDVVRRNLHGLISEIYLNNSLVTSHGPDDIYNLDALHSVPAIIFEMLVYSRPGVIELLPACSEEFTKGSVDGVVCRTRATVDSMSWDFNSKSCQANITSDVAQSIELQIRQNLTEALVDGEPVEIVSRSPDTITLDFAEGESKKVTFKWE